MMSKSNKLPQQHYRLALNFAVPISAQATKLDPNYKAVIEVASRDTIHCNKNCIDDLLI